MEIIKEADFRKEIKSAPRTGYLFYGEEDYTKGFALDLAVKTLCPDPTFSFFNEIRFDSLSFSINALLDAITAPPMMSERKIIIIKGLDFSAMKPTELNDFCSVLSRLEDFEYNTVIVNIASDKLELNKKSTPPLLKKLGEFLTPVNFEKNSPARLAAWVSKHFEHNGVSASPDICSLLIERCGKDMFNLAGEIDKISFYVLANLRDLVTKDDVYTVPTPAMEFQAFALTNAMYARNRENALNILADMKRRRVDPIIIMGELSGAAFDSMSMALLKEDGLTQGEIASALNCNPFKVSKVLSFNPRSEQCKRLVSCCREADLRIKSYSDGYEVLEKLICTF